MRYMRNNADMRQTCRSCGCTQGCVAGSAETRMECTCLPVLASIQPQVWDCTYTCGQALARGTLFPALDKPFMGKGGCCNV